MHAFAPFSRSSIDMRGGRHGKTVARCHRQNMQAYGMHTFRLSNRAYCGSGRDMPGSTRIAPSCNPITSSPTDCSAPSGLHSQGTEVFRLCHGCITPPTTLQTLLDPPSTAYRAFSNAKSSTSPRRRNKSPFLNYVLTSPIRPLSVGYSSPGKFISFQLDRVDGVQVPLIAPGRRST